MTDNILLLMIGYLLSVELKKENGLESLEFIGDRYKSAATNDGLLQVFLLDSISS